jgi:nitrous oxide reductase accessory protein NosL
MTDRARIRGVAATWLVVGAIAASGCGVSNTPPKIVSGTECAACGMPIVDLRFACERKVERRWRAYDSIECLIRQGADEAWLADYDSKSLHAADSMWVVHGSFPSPMGAGLAAFLERDAAADVAERTSGRIARLAEFAATETAP